MEVGLDISVLIPNSETPVFSLAAKVNGMFEIAPGTDANLIQQFAESSAAFLIWPYAREIFQNLSMRMRIPMIVLPTLDTGVTSVSSSSEGTRTGTVAPKITEATE